MRPGSPSARAGVSRSERSGGRSGPLLPQGCDRCQPETLLLGLYLRNLQQKRHRREPTTPGGSRTAFCTSSKVLLCALSSGGSCAGATVEVCDCPGRIIHSGVACLAVITAEQSKPFCRISLNRNKVARVEMARALRTIAEHALKRVQFENNAEYREAIGASFRGLDSAWDDLHIVLRWYQEVFGVFPNTKPHTEPFRRLLFTTRIERLRAIRAGVATIVGHRSCLERVVERITEFTRAVPSQYPLTSSGSFDEIVACLNKLAQDLTELFCTQLIVSTSWGCTARCR